MARVTDKRTNQLQSCKKGEDDTHYNQIIMIEQSNTITIYKPGTLSVSFKLLVPSESM